MGTLKSSLTVENRDTEGQTGAQSPSQNIYINEDNQNPKSTEIQKAPQ